MILANASGSSGPSFSLSNRILRIIWNFVYIIFFRFTPVPFHSWRIFLLRVFGARIGKNCRIYNSSIFWAPWNISIGDNSCIAQHVDCYSIERITIGSNTVVSQHVYICTGSHDYNSHCFQLIASPICIGNNAWVCTRSFIGPGVSIGHGTVIGACSVVVKDQSSWTIAAGNPCNFLKHRKQL